MCALIPLSQFHKGVWRWRIGATKGALFILTPIKIRTILGLMKPSERIKPISYVKSHVSEIVGSLSENGEPLIITQNGEAKAVLLDYDSYKQSRETFALLKILALGNKQIDEGKVVPASQAICRIRKRRETA